MREIKFRAWDGSQMHEWGILGEGFYAPPTVPDAKLTNYKTMVHMQFIGIKDKNGKEIYEGDIISDRTIVTAIEWDNLFGRWCSRPGTHLAWANCEVIGNIYENPDLIK